MVPSILCQSVGVAKILTNSSPWNSGSLGLLEHGYVVLPDRGFDIHEDVTIHGGKLEIPSFTLGKKQLSMDEVEYS